VTLLSRAELRQRIFEGDEEQLLRREWAHSKGLRAAGYDLRIARDDVQLNGEDWVGDPEHNVITLKPGDVASVSTYERFCMPWDVAANIGVRFHLAQRGLLVFTGLLVDPGFGLEIDHHGDWRPKADERLRFLIANIGADPISLELGPGGSRPLSLQFFAVEPCDVQDRKAIAHGPDQLKTSALSVFTSVRELAAELAEHVAALRQRDEELQEALRDAQAATAEQVAEQAKLLDAEDKRLDSVLRSVRSSTDQIVVFGVFLLAITVLGVVLSNLLDGLSSGKFATAVDNLNKLHVRGFGPIALCVAGLLVALTVAIVSIWLVTYSFVVVGRHRRANETPGQ
jgi:deoxycytidine triphosphate deaminase